MSARGLTEMTIFTKLFYGAAGFSSIAFVCAVL
jgi:hypothetical protein